MIYLGIDPGLSSLAFVAVKGDSVYHQEVFRSCQRGSERLFEIEDKVKSMLLEISPSVVAIEGYSHASRFQTHSSGELGWAIRRILRGYDWIVVSPSMLKKFATGKGNVKKDLILQQVYKRWGVEFNNSDLADAFVLAKVAQAYKEDEKSTSFQKEVLESVQKEGVKSPAKKKG